RQIIQQIADRRNALGGKNLRQSWANSLDVLHRRSEFKHGRASLRMLAATLNTDAGCSWWNAILQQLSRLTFLVNGHTVGVLDITWCVGRRNKSWATCIGSFSLAEMSPLTLGQLVPVISPRNSRTGH